ncbi:hypothetical protein PVAND_015469 [Polypedilum vanderplanki]|uniref:C2H2-type domain-containing protein n=1 Tax=Polypedilum vanderplanki TaxID=319348 RepID=A0A9J6BC94_POLVA|nr:hypothetical protein PVAND_015469 [Polypedilum vanderplanki]
MSIKITEITRNHQDIQIKVENEEEITEDFKQNQNTFENKTCETQKCDIKKEPEMNFLLVIEQEKVKEKSKDDKYFQCEICSMILKKSNKNKHLQIHSKNYCVYECDYCDVKCFSKDRIVLHIKQHKIEKFQKYQCNFDGKYFYLKTKLIAHMKKHQSAKECDICGKLTKYLIQHKNAYHSNEDCKLQCQKCKKWCKSRPHLNDHLRSHNKRYQCQFCDRKFSHPNKFKIHIQLHKNPELFQCKICKHNYSSKVNLMTHERIHDKNRLKCFECDFCDYSTDIKYSILLHLFSHIRSKRLS